MKLFVIDTETSDLEPSRGASILELAWMEISFDQIWEPSNWSSSYIQYTGPINPHALAAHHIRADKLTEERGAVRRDQAVSWLAKHLEKDSILVAHNIDFDAKFLPELKHPWICTFRSAKHIWPEAPGYGNQVLRYWLNLEPASEAVLRIAPIVAHQYPHQALYDVATTTGILLKMLEKYTVEQLLKLTAKPLQLQKIGFGKHKGTNFNQIPRDYLLWLRQQGDLDNDLKHTIDAILRS